MRRASARIVAGAALVALVAGSTAASATQTPAGGPPTTVRIVTVVKVLGIGWFERMDVGIERFAARTGVDATLTGPRQATSEQQIAIIRRLIGERPDAI